MLRLSLIFLLPVLVLSAPPAPAARSRAGVDLAMAAVVADPTPPLANTRDSGWAWARAVDVPGPEACLGHGQAFADGCLAWLDAQDRARDAQIAANFR